MWIEINDRTQNVHVFCLDGHFRSAREVLLALGEDWSWSQGGDECVVFLGVLLYLIVCASGSVPSKVID